MVSTDDLNECVVHATDGPIGQVTDCYFDDAQWIMRYLVVETGSWLASRKVLVSPASILTCEWGRKIICVSINRGQVRHSPDIDTDKPVSRQHELRLHGHYGLSPYWPVLERQIPAVHHGILAPQVDGLVEQVSDHSVEPERARAETEVARHEKYDPCLRSANAIRRYQLVATDGELGIADGLLLEEPSWAVRYLIVNTGNFWLEHRVLIAPQSILAVRWLEEAVCVDLTCERIQAATALQAAGGADTRA